MFLKPEVQAWFCMHVCVYFSHFTAQCSYKPSLTYKVMLSLQKPFPDGVKVQTAFATLQGNTLQE